jgi:TonB-linked SusC/RagA family outer membrane protein
MALVMLLVGAVPSWAQARGTIRGRVTESLTERPLAGARLDLVGSARSGLSDANGEYVITEVPAGRFRVRVSIIGYSRMEATVTVPAGQTIDLNFAMNRSAITLDEVVVTGTAGAQEKRTIGNSIGSVKVGGQLETAPITNVSELLTARTPGLTLMTNSGQTGSSSNIRIRGAGSLNAGYAPVFYVDGIRIEGGVVEAASTYQGGSALDFLNPEDIESIEVIKGPAAATLYGADAANGVIQIITKKGRRGAETMQWTSSVEVGENEWTESVGANTTYWRCTASNQASSTYPGCGDPSTVQWWGNDPSLGGECTTHDGGQYDGVTACLNTGIPASDITDIGDGTFLIQDNPLFRHPAALRKGSTFDFNLSARGGTGFMGYFLSFNRTAEDGVFHNNFLNRTGGRANFDMNVHETMDMAVQFSYTRTHLRQPLNNNASNSINRNGMRGRARAQRRTWEPGFRGFNPWLSNEFNRQNRIERMTIGLTTNWSPFRWFRHRLTLGLDKQNYRETDFYTQDTTGLAPWGSDDEFGSVLHEIPNIHRWTVDYSGSVDLDVSETLNSVFSAGMQLNARTYRGFFAEGEGLVANNLNLVGSSAVRDADEQLSEQTSLGFYLQEQVGWRDRVFVTGAVRIDDNSAFGSDFSLVVYPKASVSWLVSEEAFYNVGFMDELKLRLAWGKAGNAPAPFEADRTYTTGQGVAQDALVNTLITSEFGNPDLKAESGVEWEMGFDASLLNGRAGVEFTYYDQRTKDALISVPDAGSTGFTGSHLINVGEISNTGIELLLTGTPIVTRNFTWDAGLAFSTNKNRLVSFGRDADGNPIREEIIFGSFADVQRHREGFQMGAFWANDVERGPDGEPILDASGNVDLLSSCRWAPSDPTWDRATECDDIYMGPSRPVREAALTNTFTVFGNVRIYAQFDYRGGHWQWCAICSINSRIDRNTWDINTGGTPLNPGVSDAEVEALRSRQTLSHITQADFIKFRELSLTYSLPESWTRFIPGGSRWAVTLAGRNLAVWTKYEGRGDPEVQMNPNSSFTMRDYASTPQTRRVSAALRVTF